MGRDERSIAEIRATLYALSPEEFTAARDAEAAQATGAFARRIRALRRPTLGAWLVNLLAAHRADELNELLTIGERLRDAHKSLRGQELRELSSRRQAVITSLLSLARDLAAERGKQIREGAVREAESTLRAALADPDVAHEVRAGALVKAAEYSGLGLAYESPAGEDAAAEGDDASTGGDSDAAASEQPSEGALRRGRARLRVILGGRSDEDEEAAPPPQRASRSRAAAKKAESAPGADQLAAERRQRLRAALEVAERDIEEAGAAERQATRRLGEIAAELDELRIRERQLRGEQAEVDRDRRRSQRRRQAAEKSAADTRRRIR